MVTGTAARAGRRGDQVGHGAVPLLAARRHGGAHPGQRLPARRGDGEGRHLPRRPARARLRRRPRLAAGRARPGPGHDAGRRLPRAAPDRPQAAARLRHRQPARLPHGARRRRQPGAGRRRAGDDRWPTRCSSPRCSSPSASSTTRPAPATCAGSPGWAAGSPSLAVVGDAGRGVDGRAPAAARLRRQGGGLRRAAGRRAARPHRGGRRPDRARRRLGADRRLQRPLRLGRVRPQARAAGPAPAELAHRPGPLFLAAAGRARRSPGWSPGRPARCSSRSSPRYADTLPLLAPEAEHLALWHGWQPALALSALVAARRRGAVRRPHAGSPRLQRRVAVGASADEGYWNVLQGLDRLSVLVTGTTQRGSLPAYLGTILVVVLALPGTVLLTRAPWPGEWRAWDTPVQALVGAVVLIAAGAGAAHPPAALGGARRRRHRLRRRRASSPCRARPTWRSPSSSSRR